MKAPLGYSIVMAGRSAVHERTGKVLAEELEVATSMVALTAGLMFRRALEPGRGMWLNPCNGIHMMFMNFPIDAVFLDSHERVKKVYRKLPQWWGVVWFVWGARSVLELPAGSTADIDLQRGDQVLIS
jgi:uncharacterized membrane protein (UPF0127 family)